MKTCKAGNCDVQLPTEATKLSHSIDWSAHMSDSLIVGPAMACRRFWTTCGGTLAPWGHYRDKDHSAAVAETVLTDRTCKALRCTAGTQRYLLVSSQIGERADGFPLGKRNFGLKPTFRIVQTISIGSKCKGVGLRLAQKQLTQAHFQTALDLTVCSKTQTVRVHLLPQRSKQAGHWMKRSHGCASGGNRPFRTRGGS